MGIDFEDKSYVPFISTISDFLVKSCDYKNYFKRPKEKNIQAQLDLFKLLKNNIKLKTTITDSDMYKLIDKLREKTDEKENYEFSQLLTDVKSNYNKIREFEIQIKKRTKK